MKMRLVFLSLFLFCVTKASSAEGAVSGPAAIISAYSAAWNTQNLEQMAALMHPDIEWLSVNGSETTVETQGKAALVNAMREWFASPNLPSGSLRDWSINGHFVAVTETASWLDKTQQLQSQSALTVYELTDNLIRRVYYYPSVKNE